jgi:hypothetical protein
VFRPPLSGLRTQTLAFARSLLLAHLRPGSNPRAAGARKGDAVMADRTARWTGSTLLLGWAIACSTATPAQTPGVEPIGATQVRYRGPEVEVVLSYGFANTRLGEDWLFLDTSITGTTRESVEVKRTGITIRTPSGTDIPLASQAAFGEAYPKLAAALARADVAYQPIGNYPSRRAVGLDFQVVPGTAIAFDSVWVSNQVVAVGRLLFHLEDGIQPGPYELRIDLDEARIRIPFRLGPGGQGTGRA